MVEITITVASGRIPPTKAEAYHCGNFRAFRTPLSLVISLKPICTSACLFGANTCAVVIERSASIIYIAIFVHNYIPRGALLVSIYIYVCVLPYEFEPFECFAVFYFLHGTKPKSQPLSVSNAT